MLEGDKQQKCSHFRWKKKITFPNWFFCHFKFRHNKKYLCANFTRRLAIQTIKQSLEPQGKLDLCSHYLLIEIVKICRHWIIASFFKYVFIDMIDNIIHSWTDLQGYICIRFALILPYMINIIWLTTGGPPLSMWLLFIPSFE